MRKQYQTYYVLQGYYGSYGWEDIAAGETRTEMIAERKAHQSTEGGKFRIVKRRELVEGIELYGY